MIPDSYKIDFSESRKDLIQQSLNRLLYQYQNAPVIRQIVSAYAKQYQELHDAIIDLMEHRTLYNAKGVYAEGIGRILGRGRQIAFADGSNLIADDNFFQTLLVSQTLKNSTKFSSVLELNQFFRQAFGYNVGVELVGPMVVNLYVPAWASDEVEAYIRPLADSLTVEHAYVSPFPATLTIDKLIHFEVLTDKNGSDKRCLIHPHLSEPNEDGIDVWYLGLETTTVFATTEILLSDSNGSGKKCKVEARFNGVDDEGNDIWSMSLETYTGKIRALNRRFGNCSMKARIIGVDDLNKDIWSIDLTTIV